MNSLLTLTCLVAYLALPKRAKMDKPLRLLRTADSTLRALSAVLGNAQSLSVHFCSLLITLTIIYQILDNFTIFDIRLQILLKNLKSSFFIMHTPTSIMWS